MRQRRFNCEQDRSMPGSVDQFGRQNRHAICDQRALAVARADRARLDRSSRISVAQSCRSLACADFGPAELVDAARHASILLAVKGAGRMATGGPFTRSCQRNDHSSGRGRPGFARDGVMRKQRHCKYRWHFARPWLKERRDWTAAVAPQSGEAPRGLDYRAMPAFCTPWTFLGVPLTLPGCFGAGGLPLGVQLIAAKVSTMRVAVACRVGWKVEPAGTSQLLLADAASCVQKYHVIMRTRTAKRVAMVD